MRLLVILFFPIMLIVFLLHYAVVGQAVYGDGIYYFATTHSLYKDADIDFGNELSHHYSRTSNNKLIEEPRAPYTNRSATGMAKNKYNIGAPLLWLPAFALADIVANITAFFTPVPTLGYSDIYQVVVGTLNVFFMWVGAFLLFLYFKKNGKTPIALAVIFSLLFGTYLFYYGAIDVANSHPSSFLAATIFFLLWVKTYKKRPYKISFLLGVTTGVLMLIRTQEVAFLLFLYIEQLFLLRNRSTWPLALKHILLFTSGTVLIFFPQMLSWKLLYGSFFTSPYFVEKEGFTFLHPHILEVLFNTTNGLFIWTPLLLVALVGLFFLAKKDIAARFALLLFFIELYLVSSWSGWTQGESFGIRMLIPTLPFLSLGIAHVYKIVSQKYTIKTVYIISLLFAALNAALILYFLLIKQSPTIDMGSVTQVQSLQKIEELFKRLK